MNSNHGQYFFVFPKTIEADFSGCQTVWVEEGRKVVVVSVTNGIPTKIDLNFSDDDRILCTFVDGKFESGHREDCTGFMDLILERRGWPVVPDRFNPTVPPERDLRLKNKK